ncbi:MAG: GNAT family N-acetyltransferase [Candidatus Kerfeldbacteria bacterium]|nr:GNAT family N-acetyltransferase [Candidatus Kerfeldbacteria bacterium]
MRLGPRLTSFILLDKAWRFRSSVFDTELHWVASGLNGRETDRWDNKKTTNHLVIHEGGRVVGYSRIVEGREIGDFMFGDSFFQRFLRDQRGVVLEILAQNHYACVEVSRFAIRAGFRAKPEVANRLVFEIAEWCVSHRKRWLMMIVTADLLSALAKRGVDDSCFIVKVQYGDQGWFAILDLRVTIPKLHP